VREEEQKLLFDADSMRGSLCAIKGKRYIVFQASTICLFVYARFVHEIFEFVDVMLCSLEKLDKPWEVVGHEPPPLCLVAFAKPIVVEHPPVEKGVLVARPRPVAKAWAKVPVIDAVGERTSRDNMATCQLDFLQVILFFKEKELCVVSQSVSLSNYVRANSKEKGEKKGGENDSEFAIADIHVERR